MKRVITVLMAVAALWISAFARDINVRGIVTDSDGHPLQGVCIYNAEDEKLLASTNEEGKFFVIIDSDGRLIFSILGSEDLEIPVEGRLTMDVSMAKSSINLDEVVVQAKGKANVLMPEPTDIEVKGNYLTVKTRVKVPKHMFGASKRLIIQPALYNVTRRTLKYMKPLVFDGFRYNITQERMYDFDISSDPLAKYIEIRGPENGKGNAMINYHDSIYVDDPDDDFHVNMMMAMENYNRVYYRDTTTIARGVVNPLRFFKYSLDGSEITDSAYMPTPEMQLRDTKGDVSLTFAVGKDKLDMEQGDNRREMNVLLDLLKTAETSRDAAIKSFSIYTTASPEGNYEKNLDLARRRMNSALQFIYSNLSASTRKYIETHSDAKVSSWEPVVEMLCADSLTAEAADVQKIIDRYPGKPDSQFAAIARLPYYRDLLAERYLPRLRRVSYEFVTSQFRYLTDEEIASIYATNPAELSRYEFFRLYRNESDSLAKEAILRKALEVHPKFLVAANDLSALLIEKGEPDPDLLGNFLVPGAKNIPDEARYTQVVACLSTKRFHEADSLASILDGSDPRYHRARLYTDVFNSRYQDALQEIASESPFNEVLMLLCIKANDQAWRKAQQLGDSAEENYVKAIAANRVNEYMPAVNALERAFELNPQLREVAKVDGDLIELLEDL